MITFFPRTTSFIRSARASDARSASISGGHILLARSLLLFFRSLSAGRCCRCCVVLENRFFNDEILPRDERFSPKTAIKKRDTTRFNHAENHVRRHSATARVRHGVSAPTVGAVRAMRGVFRDYRVRCCIIIVSIGRQPPLVVLVERWGWFCSKQPRRSRERARNGRHPLSRVHGSIDVPSWRDASAVRVVSHHK